ncbi:MAG: class I SAM-dependent methyltransferase [Myxococcota bacterium]
MLGALRELWVWLRDQLSPESRAFDREFGTATSWHDFGNYEPSLPSVVGAVLDAIPDPERCTFVDLGSGKGRVVLLAAGRPFRRVVGVEHRRALHRRAQRNEAAYTGPIVCRPEWVCADARAVELPDGPLVVFLYNPFGIEVLDAVLARIARPDVRIAAVHPPDSAYMAAHGFTVLVHHPADSPDRRWTLFGR